MKDDPCSLVGPASSTGGGNHFQTTWNCAHLYVHLHAFATCYLFKEHWNPIFLNYSCLVKWWSFHPIFVHVWLDFCFNHAVGMTSVPLKVHLSRCHHQDHWHFLLQPFMFFYIGLIGFLKALKLLRGVWILLVLVLITKCLRDHGWGFSLMNRCFKQMKSSWQTVKPMSNHKALRDSYVPGDGKISGIKITSI